MQDKSLSERLLNLEKPHKDPLMDAFLSKLEMLKDAPHFERYSEQLRDFSNELTNRVNSAYCHINIDEFSQLIDFSNDIIEAMNQILNIDKANQSNPEEIKRCIDNLKERMPSSNTLGRICLGLLAAFITPLLLICETLFLPFVTKPYEYTRSCANYVVTMFHPPVDPAIKIIETIYREFQEIILDDNEISNVTSHST